MSAHCSRARERKGEVGWLTWPTVRSAGTRYFFLSIAGMSVLSAFSQITYSIAKKSGQLDKKGKGWRVLRVETIVDRFVRVWMGINSQGYDRDTFAWYVLLLLCASLSTSKVKESERWWVDPKEGRETRGKERRAEDMFILELWAYHCRPMSQIPFYLGSQRAYCCCWESLKWIGGVKPKGGGKSFLSTLANQIHYEL